MNLEFVVLFLEWLRMRVEFTSEEVLSAVNRVKAAWLAAFTDTVEMSMFGGEDLNEGVSLIQVGLFSAKERLKSLVEKIGDVKHEVEQLLGIDAMHPKRKAKFGAALRTRDATPLVRSVGWQGWLRYAMMYRKVAVSKTFKALATYDTNGMCFPCSGTGYRTCRVPHKHPRLVVHQLAEGLTETIVETHKTTRRKCLNCKGTGKRVSPNTAVAMPFDLVDVIELAGLMAALDEHEGRGGVVHQPAGLDEHPRMKYHRCNRCGKDYRGDVPERCTESVPWWAMPHDPTENTWLPLVVECGGKVVKSTDTTADDASDFHETMHHNAIMDIFDRENEPGGDINTSEEDRSFSLDKELEEMNGQFHIQLLKKWKAKWLDWEPGMLPFMKKRDGGRAVTIDLHDPFTSPDYTRAGIFPRRSGEEPEKFFDPELEIKFGTKQPSVFTKGGRYRGCHLTINEGYADGYGEKWFTSGRFREIVTDRIYAGHFAWDPTFYSYRDVRAYEDWACGTKHPYRRAMRWASLCVVLDQEIRDALDGLPDDAYALNVGIGGDMAEALWANSPCPMPTQTLWFENGDIKIPVANFDGKAWFICNHVKEVSYRVKLARWLVSGRPIPVNHKLEKKKAVFSNGVRAYPGFPTTDREGNPVWVVTGPVEGKPFPRKRRS